MVSDHELMHRFVHGEESAFVELVQRHQRPIASYLVRILGSRARSEDLAQEVFLRVFRHRFDYTRQAAFTTWCYTIATNLARDEIRSLRRRPVRSGLEGLQEVPSEGEEPGSALDRRETRDLVRKALGGLVPAFREVLVLRDLQGLSYGEISGILGLELGTVKSRINRARLAFKEVFVALEARGGEPR